jgi:hypothetical protein
MYGLNRSTHIPLGNIHTYIHTYIHDRAYPLFRRRNTKFGSDEILFPFNAQIPELRYLVLDTRHAELFQYYVTNECQAGYSNW